MTGFHFFDGQHHVLDHPQWQIRILQCSFADSRPIFALFGDRAMLGGVKLRYEKYLEIWGNAIHSLLVDVLTELVHLRRLKLAGTTPTPVFFPLKRVFHLLESLGSARIEGNHTTLADYVERSLEGTDQRVRRQADDLETGRLSPEWTVECLLGKHASAPFNPDVANAFFRVAD